MAQSLEKALNAIVGEFAPRGHHVSGLKRLSGGASQETWQLSVDFADGSSVPFILRRSPGEGARSDEALPLGVEAALMTLGSQAGVPGPEVKHVSDASAPLGEGFIMTHVQGETIPQRIMKSERLAEARTTFSKDAGTALARIHGVPVATLPDRLPHSPGHDQLDRYERIYLDLGVCRPAFDLVISHLRRTLPTPLPPCLVHGDFRMGNFIMNCDGIAAVLDWELAHIGDPREDMGWICVNSWRFGRAHLPVGGAGTLVDFLRAYADAGGQSVAPDDLVWWQLLGTLKWGVMCMIMYDTWRSGDDRSVERAAIGRRVSETEVDMLDLLAMVMDHV